MYAEIVVDVPLRRRSGQEGAAAASPLEMTFHYAVPPRLAAEIALGQLVVVPFGNQEQQGVVVALGDTSPVAETKDIAAISDPQPALSFPQIQLARWLSRHYLAPLPRTVKLMLPPGLIRRPKIGLEPGAAAPKDGLSERERALLDALRQQGRLPLAEARQILGAGASEASIRRLVRLGYVVKRHFLAEATVRPKVDRLVRLRADEGTIERQRLRLGRASKQADVLSHLLESGPSQVSVEWVRQQAGCKDGPLRSLEARGWVRLAADGASIALAVPAGETAEEIIALRNSRKHLAVLDYLQGEAEPVWIGWVYAETGCTLETLRNLQKHGLIAFDEEEVNRDPLSGRDFSPSSAPQLTLDQQSAWDSIQHALTSGQQRPFLLHGVTGSGKTEIYLRALEVVLSRGQGGIVLVPEIALTPQTIQRFASRFPGLVAVQHSGLSQGERYDQWRQVRARKLPVVVGTRSALFAPVPNLGLIVIDEEHDSSYKQDSTTSMPAYHARDAALQLARLTGASVIMGSATPDLTSYALAKRGDYSLLELPRRVADCRPRSGDQRGLPPVEVVDMREELRAGNRSIFSRSLTAAIRGALRGEQQIILFLNRRGSATFVMCRDCGAVLKCPRCDVSLTYHARELALRCHHCNRQVPATDRCPHCGSRHIKFFGLGTEKVAALTAEAFPEARLLRWDRDVTQTKGAHELILDRFIRREADILVGTQMVAKGLDLPLVTVVGVISADTGLYLPDFRAGERTFQLLTQVAGRAGRGPAGGQVIVQTYTPDHYAVRAASQHDYASFFHQEMAFRKQHHYPPYARLARLVYSHEDEARCRQQAHSLSERLNRHIARLGLPGVGVIGPAPCFLGRLKGKARWHLIVRARNPLEVMEGLSPLPGWQVDVDPLNLL